MALIFKSLVITELLKKQPGVPRVSGRFTFAPRQGSKWISYSKTLLAMLWGLT